ncbi:MAG: ABC transporter permease [Pseudomonadota bacterium]
MAERAGPPALEVRGLNVFYGRSHALQGVDLTLGNGVLSVVGRNGMGKTTLCKAIMGMQPASGGSIRVNGEDVAGKSPADIARMGVGYVPQGRRLWRSLTVDEHLKMVARPGGSWSPERIYATFPRLAERRQNGGGQLSGGEQQMLAISRALLLNPRLLVMDEPTEGLAPVIVAQVEEMLIRLGQEGDVDVLVIEQNIGVACEISEQVAIMVNGRINRLMDAGALAADVDLQQRLLGVGRHGHEETDEAAEAREAQEAADAAEAASGEEYAPIRVYVSNPEPPTRWSRPVPVRVLEQTARTVTPARAPSALPAATQASAALQNRVLVCGTLDTKGPELRHIRDLLKAQGLTAILVDLSTSGKPSGAEIPPFQVAAFHPRGASACFTSDRGESVAAMTLAFERWMSAQAGIAGAISAGGSGGTALAAPAFRRLPFGTPKLIVSTIASGNVEPYVGASDIVMMPSVADVQGLNTVTLEVFANAAAALGGMVRARQSRRAQAAEKPAVGLTMFGVTTPAVQQVVAQLDAGWDCLVFHATGVGGRSMEKLIDDGKLTAVLDLTTTEICDMVAGGVFPATEDRFGAVIRTGIPYIGSCGALDMVNFQAPETVPERYRGRNLYEHNPQITLMRTTPEECAQMGRWIGERLNQMTGPVRFYLPEGGVSALSAPGKPFHDPAADAALFKALEATVRQSAGRQLIRVPHNINDPEFAEIIVTAFRGFHGSGASSTTRQRA